MVVYAIDWRCLDINNPEDILLDISDMLNRNYPVIMSVSTLESTEDRLLFYALTTDSHVISFAGTEYGFSSRHNSYGHYCTVTGLIIDSIAEEYYLRVSNAGEEEYVVFSEYVEFARNHGTVINTAVNPGNAIIYFED